MGVYPYPSTVLLLLTMPDPPPLPSNIHFLFYTSSLTFFPSLLFLFFLPSIYFLPCSILNRSTVLHSPTPCLSTFPSHQIPVFAGMRRSSIKVEISGAKADWNGTFPLLQSSSRTFLCSGWDTTSVAKEGGIEDGVYWYQLWKTTNQSQRIKINRCK